VKSFWTAFLLIFIAELGDKTQFMTLALSSRYKATVVLLGVTLGTMAVSLVSVALGAMLGGVLPRGPMSIGAGIILIVFALLSLKQAMETSKVEEEANQDIENKIHHPRHLWVTIAVTFFVAELADKTMLATVAIASRDKNYLAVWLGSTMGLVASNCLAIIAGKALSQKLSGKAMHMTAAAIFTFAGVASIWQGISGL
jgi:putative Ca2+/H+ antiporter (TMEM165/GDT1 family)